MFEEIDNMAVSEKQHFGRFGDKVKQFDVTGKTLLIPEMAPFSSRLLAACFHAVGVNALVMETYKGLSLGKEFTSGKECFPCQVTLGDVLYFLRRRKEGSGQLFRRTSTYTFCPKRTVPAVSACTTSCSVWFWTGSRNFATCR